MRLFKNFLLIGLVAVLSVSCAVLKGKHLVSETPGAKLFASAEEKYQQRFYKEAFGLYEQYVQNYAGSELVPKALLRMGQAQMDLGNYTKARALFQQVIDQYPSGAYARDASVEMLGVDYFAGKYHEVINAADRISVSNMPPEQSTRYHLIVGDSYLALRASLKAYQEFAEAFRTASPSDLDKVVSRINMVLSLMPSSQIELELRRLGGRPPASYLLFQLAKRYLAEGRIQEAAAALGSFIEKYPDHEYISQAKEMLAEITAVPAEEKLVGCLLPLSGKYEAIGQQAMKGIEMAFTDFVQKSEQAPLKISIKDTASDPFTAEQAITDLAQNNAVAIVGPVAASDEAAAKAQELKIPIVTMTQRPNITDVGDYVFRNFITPEMQVRSLITYTMGTLGVTRFAIFYPDGPYGNVFMKIFKDEAEKAGATLSAVEAYDPNQKDFEKPVKKLIGYSNWKTWDETVEANQQDETGADPLEEPDMEQQVRKYDGDELVPEVDFEAVFIPDSPEKAGLIIPLFAYYGVRNIYLLGTNLWHSDKMIQMTSSQIQGAIIPDGFFEQSKSENISRFVSEFENAYGYAPGYIEAVSYDSAMMLFDLAVHPDVKTPEDMKRSLLNMPPYQGVTGLTSFAPNGDAVKDVFLLKIIGGQFREIYY